LHRITSKHNLPLLVDHKPLSSSKSVRKHTSAGTGNDATTSLGTLMLKEIRDMRFLAFNFIKDGKLRDLSNVLSSVFTHSFIFPSFLYGNDCTVPKEAHRFMFTDKRSKAEDRKADWRR